MPIQYSELIYNSFHFIQFVIHLWAYLLFWRTKSAFYKRGKEASSVLQDDCSTWDAALGKLLSVELERLSETVHLLLHLDRRTAWADHQHDFRMNIWSLIFFPPHFCFNTNSTPASSDRRGFLLFISVLANTRLLLEAHADTMIAKYLTTSASSF